MIPLLEFIRELWISADINKNVQNKVQNSKFALQVDVYTNISNKAHLLEFIHFVDSNQIINPFLCCKEITLTAKG